MSGSPPPLRAATVSSLMRRVKILPRLASSAPFLCLIEAHLEWPDMSKLHGKRRKTDETDEMLPLFRQDDPDIGAVVPGASPVVAEHGVDREPGALELPRSSGGPRGCGTSGRSGARASSPPRRSTYFCSKVVRCRFGSWRTDSMSVSCAPPARPRSCTRFSYSRHFGHVGHEIDAERAARREDARDRGERRGEIARPDQRLQDAVRRDHHRERAVLERQRADVAADESGATWRVWRRCAT